VLNCQCREVCVRRDIACRAQRLHEPAKKCEVSFGRMENECARLCELGFVDVESPIDRNRVYNDLDSG
jgi:hypothetical protein